MREGGGTVLAMGPVKSFWGPRFQERRPTRPTLELGERPTHAHHTPSPVWASPMGPEVREQGGGWHIRPLEAPQLSPQALG